ncbi:hemerythrin domain-containing protein [Telmatospirillum siberiense]|nr:hemerythrin domain-containing protein [Telmatospirillum siberiense]
MKRGLVQKTDIDGSACETGPNAILLSDVAVQNGEFSNLSEFPILQMLYRQGMILPGHPNNKGARPLLIGLKEQVAAQLAYIHRGNYGLTSKEELIAAGVPEAEAVEWMRVKQRFAFGRIRASHELIDSCIIGETPVDIRPGVTIRRLDLNVYEIRHGTDGVVINLNLEPFETYEPPYPLNYHNLRREYFAVVHSGEGDGWDVNRPTMSSVLMFQGKVFLIDAGPNLHAVLKSLGISINEVEGIFQTHSHDDHFCGLTTLIRADRRIRYFATAAVRAAVTKKLAALMSITEASFEEYFDVRDLEIDRWNDVDGLNVKPMFSPHPVETTIFAFQALSESGVMSYGHYADIVSFDVLDQMTTEDPNLSGISPALAAKVRDSYLMPVDVKKIDIGGGLIHGSAEDFAEDRSSRIILAHTAVELSNTQRKIGSGAPFGTVDVLIPSVRDYALQKAHGFLTAYFPDVPSNDLEMLLNRPILDINAEAIVLRQGELCGAVTMSLTGLMEVVDNEGDSRYLLSSGILIGECACLHERPVTKTYRAASFVKALTWPAEFYRNFIRHNHLMETILATADMRGIFARTRLFGENVSIPVLNRLVRVSSTLSLKPGEAVDEGGDCLFLIRSGLLDRRIGGKVAEVLEPGDFFGESMVLHGRRPLSRIIAHKACDLIAIPGAMLRDIPIVRWKLFETYLRRLSVLVAPSGVGSVFPWSADYAVGVPLIDHQHQKLFEIANRVILAFDRGDVAETSRTLFELFEYNKYHLDEEIKYLKKIAFPDVEQHEIIHAKFRKDIVVGMAVWKNGDAMELIDRSEFIEFFHAWIIDHIFKEDRKFARYLYGGYAE